MNQSLEKKGFTILEVSFVVALTGLLFVGTAGIATYSTHRQRYNDAVSDFAEFLRTIYSDVKNVENPRQGNRNRQYCTISASAAADNSQNYQNKSDTEPGRTNCAIYGKIAIFAENGNADEDNDNSKVIKVYDVIGDVIDNDHKLSDLSSLPDGSRPEDDTLSALYAVHAEYIAQEDGICVIAGNEYTYFPQWGARIEEASSSRTLFRGALLIVRSPLDGVVRTYSLDLSSTSYYMNTSSALGTNCSGNASSLHVKLADFFTSSASPKFVNDQIDYCVSSSDIFSYNLRRRDVRIRRGGTDYTAVEIVEFDNAGENKCLS